MKHPARLGALGALAHAAVIAALFVALVWVTWPDGSNEVQVPMSVLTWIICGGIALALVVVSVVFAKQFHDEGRRR